MGLLTTVKPPALRGRYDYEPDLIAACGGVVVYCPTSNMFLASGIPRIRAMLDRGIPVALATDGPGSNNAQDMLETLKFAVCLQKVDTLDACALLPSDVLHMALAGGALAFRQPDIGRLAPGYKADVILVDLNTVRSMPVHRVPSALVYNASGPDVDTVIVDGHILLRGKRVLHLDEDTLLAECRDVAWYLFRQAVIEVDA